MDQISLVDNAKIEALDLDLPVPLVPEEVLRKRHVLVASDTRFRAAARLLADCWRRDNGLPIGVHTGEDGITQKLGSRLSERAGRAGLNFAAPAVAQLANRELIFRQRSALYDVQRFRTNLLGSQTLAFNLLAPLALDLRLATRFAHELLPRFFATITAVKFEYAPARGDTRFGGDFSAWDAMLIGVDAAGSKRFAAVEVKFSESCDEGATTRTTAEFTEMTRTSGLYRDPSDQRLGVVQHRQFVREHLMGQAVLHQGMADAGVFVVVGPLGNHLVAQAASGYADLLADPMPGKVTFAHRSLEECLQALAACGHEGYAQQLFPALSRLRAARPRNGAQGARRV